MIKLTLGALQVFYKTILHEWLVDMKWRFFNIKMNVLYLAKKEINSGVGFAVPGEKQWTPFLSAGESVYVPNSKWKPTIPHRENKAYLRLINHMLKVTSVRHPGLKADVWTIKK